MNNKLYENMPSFSGIHTFHNIPFKEDLNKVDYAILGIPFDTAAVNRSGSRFAPIAIRSLASFSNGFGFNTNLNVVAEEALGTDLGEIEIKSGYTEPTINLIQKSIETIIKSNTIPIILGGGQLITLPEIRSINEVYGEVALIHFSANRSIDENRCCLDDGNTILKVLKEGLIIPENSIQLGIRGGYYSKNEASFMKDKGMKILSASQMHDMELPCIIQEIKTQVKDLPCLISIDMNFLDPSSAPGVDMPIAGGFTTFELRTILRNTIPYLNIKSLDLVNLVPMMDSGDITAQAADGILTDVISSLAKKKRLEVI